MQLRGVARMRLGGQRKVSSYLGTIARGFLTTVIIPSFGAVTLYAQILSPGGQNMPYGSPTDGSSAQGNQRDTDNQRSSSPRDVGEAAPDTKIEPVQVTSSDKPSLQSQASNEPNPRLKSLRAADKKGIFVVRANGAVLSQHNGALKAHVLPGDVIFVPVRTQSSTLWAKIRDLTTTLFQFGLGAATLVAVTK